MHPPPLQRRVCVQYNHLNLWQSKRGLHMSSEGLDYYTMNLLFIYLQIMYHLGLVEYKLGIYF